ncbi:DNA-binding protein [Chryseobacterium sp. H3056]|uniref:DNA-binding protein n=1 Tax=Kaistella daneshvariae TaxID=2487074 RepID=A0A3N0X1A3_9FLAO|nr:helix-turn-helix domain-containing protein [Kaistella daneshvariae]ROI10089.1 DNA-binding protein [Kaistella daneshvariae]
MSLEVLTKEDLQKFKVELLADIRGLFQVKTTEQKLWLRSAEVKELLNISAGTLQKLRLNQTLRYSRIGGTLYYKYQDIEELLQKENTDYPQST